MEIFWRVITEIGNPFIWSIVTAVFVVYYSSLPDYKRKGIHWLLTLFFPAIFFSYSITFGLKNIFKIFYPFSSFPSGHTTVAFAIASAIFLKFKRKKHLLFFILSLLIAYSRIVLGFHTFYDVVGGMVAGTLSTLIFFKIFYRKFLEKKAINYFHLRKLIHFSFILILPFLEVIPKNFIHFSIFSLLMIFALSEIFRVNRVSFPLIKLIQRITRNCASGKELIGIVVDPILFLFAVSFLFFFPFDYFLAGFIPLVVGDSISALIGKEFGRRRIFYQKRKTVEGSLAFFLSTFIAFLFFFDLRVSLVLSIFSTIVESFVHKLENLFLPFSTLLFSFLIL
jgi:dolichol kinase